MAYLVDTNVAFRLVVPSDPLYSLVDTAVLRLRQQGEVLYLTAQVLVEFQALATRPLTANGLGLTAVQASLEAQKIEAVFPLLPETPGIYSAWRTIADTYHVVGRQVFDARLVAVMQVYGITHFLTMNAGHFHRFQSIPVVEPATVK